ncbi:MAG: YiiX/YebB-like N1pC/P60 family cysteine hydrolase [Patescibacteria group bacterium]|jgi:hypothetical protein
MRNLQVADIILTRTKNANWLLRGIRNVSRSHWNHSALVFQVVHQEDADPEVLIVEALDHGIEIHRLHNYLDSKEFDIGIKRIPNLTESERERILAYFLENIDTPYDFTRLFGYVLNRAALKIAGVRIRDMVAQRIINIDNFVCSTFTQRAFYLGVSPDKRDRVMFKEGADTNFLYQLEFISPGDIAKSTNTDWLYNPHE